MRLIRRLIRNRSLGLGLLALTGAALTGCAKASELPQSPFDTAGPVARAQTDLLTLSLWFSLGIGAFVTLALLFVVFRYRDKGNANDKSVPKQIHGNHKLEIAWTLIPIIILGIVGVPTVQTAFATKATQDPNDLHVIAIGHQWWWEFQYPQLGITTANELYIPVDKDVQITLESADVIHSFWVPKLAGKMDVIPGRKNHMQFKAERIEEFYGQCAEFCGTSHANMKFRVQAISQADFAAWTTARKAGAATPTDPDAIAGMNLFMGATTSKANCIICHTVDGTKAQGKVGPNLTNVGARTTIAAGLIENTEEHLKQWIRNPQSLKPGNKMAAHPNLSDQELEQIVKYLQGLK
ncbi:MAG TPA: cytochrome c oxidase subunit II [Symbiobacteriaceae bacterium]|nr:cytochrome c oxidase subunit II [Symbiobacteriaceae bacterium]